MAQFGVPNVLADPVLELHGPGPFVTIVNNDWMDDPLQKAAIIASGIPPTNNLDVPGIVWLEKLLPRRNPIAGIPRRVMGATSRDSALNGGT